ncbi:MAG: succinyl-CoA--3-ketoacid-CoA transferase [Oscillospiraceae bacterium]|nr:succinyl-CoA--3-ketoacid-CoA transferase [Oscillospiraceae bacterium]
MKEFSKEEKQERIAKNVAALINEDPYYTFVNLGVGIPTLVANYISRDDVYILAENGMLGVGPVTTPEHAHPDLINAGRQPVLETRGCCYMDSVMAFGMIRGGHIDATVLGAFEVAQNGDVANWIIPGGKQLGVGGAMDLVSGAKRVIIAMTHTSKTGPKLVRKCSLPLTARGKAAYVVTEYGVFAFDAGRITLIKLAPEITLDEIRSVTDVDYEVSESLRSMAV